MSQSTVPSTSLDIAEEVKLRSIVVLDTSVLVSDPEALSAFGEAEVVVPLTVIEELDGLKTRSDEVGWAARAALRTVEALRVEAGGDLRAPLPLHTGGFVRVEPNGLHLEKVQALGLSADKADNRILAACCGLANSGRPVTLVSGDTGLRIKASQLNVIAADYTPHAGADMERIGWRTVDVDHYLIDEMHSTGSADVEAVSESLVENEGVVLRAGSQSALARRQGDQLRVIRDRGPVWDLKARSAEQRFAIDLLMDPEVSVVALSGPAGCGKTIMALAAGLEQVVEMRRYDHIGIYRPPVAVGHADLGFLPGTLDEKLDAWTEAIDDNLTALAAGDRKAARTTRDELVEQNQLAFGSIAHVPGRSISNAFIILDEAQNLEATTIKTLLTRVGEGAKIVVVGDTSQIDSPFLSGSNNGLSTLIAAFGGQPCFGHISLARTERSGVAALAAELL